MKRLRSILNFIGSHPLAGRHRLKAYRKFFYWQFSQFIYPHETIVPFVGKTKLSVKKGLTGATGNIYVGLHEFEDMAFLLHFLRKEDLFADIGANVGSYTVLAAGHVGTKTLCFEPVPSTFHWLQKNISLNYLQDKTKAFNLGLGSKKIQLLFTSAYDTINHVASVNERTNDPNVIEVQIETLDTITQKEGIPHLIKMDVEGYETEVVKGMSKTLESGNLKAIIIELNGSGGRYGFDESWIHFELDKHGFKPYRYHPFNRELEQIKNLGNQNTIYIRDVDYVKQRLGLADKIQIFSEEF